MHVLDRYLAQRVLTHGVAASLVLVLLFVLITLGDELNKLNADYTLGAAFLVALAQAPRWLFELFPSAMLVGLVSAASALMIRSEWVAMQAGGYAVGRLVGVVGGVSLVLAVAVGWLYDTLAPAAEGWVAELKGREVSGALVLGEAVWLRGPDEVRVLRGVARDRIGQLEVYELTDGRLRRLLRMEGLRRLGLGRWQAREWVEWVFSEERVDRSSARDRVVTLTVDERLTRLVERRVGRMGLAELGEAIASLRAHGLDARRYEVRYFGELFFPWYVVNLALLGLLVTVRQIGGRMGMAKQIALGVLVGVVAYLASNAWDYVLVLYTLEVWQGKLAFQLALSTLNGGLWWSLRRLPAPVLLIQKTGS